MRTLLKSEKVRQNLDAVAAAEYFTYVTAMTYFSIGNTNTIWNAPEFSRYDATAEFILTHKITFHGLRHTYAHEKYNEFINSGKNEKEARRMVSELLGHHRDDVTRIYLSGGDENV